VPLLGLQQCFERLLSDHCWSTTRITQAVEPFPYDRVFGAFWDPVIERDGKAVVRQSAERYLRAIGH
jgi:hypothetical protein